MRFITLTRKAVLALGCACLVLGLSSFSAYADPGARTAVGQVSFVIGVVKSKAPEGKEQEITKGAAVHVGDQLITQAGGHVHIQFIDGAKVSLRPSSRLTIEDYSQGQNGRNSAIRFRLDEGVMRSMTGGWGEAERERFRLNTPLAAIGIKGTDFIVKTDANRTLASVVTGSIILSPMDLQCRSSLGACDNGRAQILSDAMNGQLLELKKGQLNPSLIPAFDLLAKKDAVTLRTAMLTDKKKLASSDEAATTEPDAAAGDPANQSVTLGTTAITTAQNVLASKEDLIWVRFPWVQRFSGDQFTKSFEEAKLSGMEALAGIGSYALYRDNSINPVFNPNVTSANFQLKDSLATFYNPSTFSHQLVSVDRGTLTVNFANNTFATTLGMHNATLGSTSIAAQGVVTGNGNLIGTSGDAWLQGGLNNTGKNAGYLFEKTYSQGTVSGITLWGRK